MNRDDVIWMVRKAGFHDGGEELFWVGWDGFERFANLIASHVAKECAKEAEDHLCGDYEGLPTAIRSLYKPTA